MATTVEELFLDHSVKKLDQLRERILTCLGKLPDDALWARSHENENAVGNLILHLCGNLGQWIGAGVGERDDTRVRPLEFSTRGDVEKGELIERLNGAVDMAAGIIRNVPHARLTEPLTVQKYEVTVMSAIYHVVEHFSQHTGQIILLTKHFSGEDLGFYRHLNVPQHAEKTP